MLYFTIKQKKKEKTNVEQAKTNQKPSLALSEFIRVLTVANSVMCCLEGFLWG